MSDDHALELTIPAPRRPASQGRKRRPTPAKPVQPTRAPGDALAESVKAGDQRWYRIDLHLHTPASLDYQERGVTPIHLLRQATQKHLDIIALTDHNSVSGYATLLREIEDLELLERLKRLSSAEADLLAEYRSLQHQILVLPGFEFTATFGFHILAIFPETTTVRQIEHLLMVLNVAEGTFGSGEVGATTDVLTAYRILSDNGAIVIGSHANSTNGVAMRGVRFGGQTKIAYTQDENLHALELTDLEVALPRRSSAKTWDGTRPGYPRRMHLLQGSDAHRLSRDEKRPTNLGIGDRPSEAWLPGKTFSSLMALLKSDRFDHLRAASENADPGQAVFDARTIGPDERTSFHEQLSTRRLGMAPVLTDIVAFSNGQGGSLYIGISENPKRPLHGVPDTISATAALRSEVQKAIDPAPDFGIESVPVRGKTVLSVQVKPGANKPFVLTPGGIYVRNGAITEPATREQIVGLSLPDESGTRAAAGETPSGASKQPQAKPKRGQRTPVLLQPDGNGSRPAGTTPPDGRIAPPTGVEIVNVQEENGTRLYAMRDLRSDETTPNVQLETARGLWKYAIQQAQGKALLPGHVKWRGDFGYWKGFRHRTGEPRHNLVYREGKDLRIFYGVSEESLTDAWRAVLPAAKPRAKIDPG